MLVSQHKYNSSLTSSKGHNSAGRVGTLGVLADVVETLQDPPNSAVPAAHQDFVVGNVTKHVKSVGKVIEYFNNGPQ